MKSTPPRKEDALFRANSSDWLNNACVNFARRDAETLYAAGYWRAAELLIAHVVKRGRDQDFLIYPIVFLYRHHIELKLKKVKTRALGLLGRKELNKGHSLGRVHTSKTLLR